MIDIRTEQLIFLVFARTGTEKIANFETCHSMFIARFDSSIHDSRTGGSKIWTASS